MRCPPSGPGGGPPRAASPLLPLQGPKVARPGLHIETAVAVVSAWTQVVAVWVSWGAAAVPGGSLCSLPQDLPREACAA